MLHVSLTENVTFRANDFHDQLEDKICKLLVVEDSLSNGRHVPPIANTFPGAQSELGSVVPSDAVNTEICMRMIFIIVHDLGVSTFVCGLGLLTAWPGKKIYNSVYNDGVNCSNLFNSN